MSARNLARERLNQSFAARIERELERLERYQQQEQPALYAGGGTIKPLGAEPIRARGLQTTGGLAIGSPVSQSQGLVSGMPSLSSDSTEAIAALKTSLAEVAFNRGFQVGQGDPTTAAARARYPYDGYLDQGTITLYYWQPGTTTAPGEWKPITGGREELNGYIESPVVKSYPLITSCRYRTKVIALYATGNATATLNPAPETVIEVGGTLSLVVSDLGAGGDYAFTVELERA